MNTTREKIYEKIVNDTYSKNINFRSLLNILQKYNLLCQNEVDFYYQNNYFSMPGKQFLEAIQNRVVYHRKIEQEILNSKVKLGGFIKVGNGSRIQGTSHIGGLQPPYIVDTRSKEIVNFLSDVKKNTENLDTNEKIKIVSNIIKNYIDETNYDDPVYLKLLEKYRTDNLEIPLSEYLKIRKGVCREISLLTTIALNSIGINAYYYYSKIMTNFGHEKKEDHAIVLAEIDGDLWTIDNYFKAFNNFKFEEICQGVISKSGTVYNPEYITGEVKILHSTLYPQNNHNYSVSEFKM